MRHRRHRGGGLSADHDPKIADRAGIAMSVVLYHFGTKDGLIEAVIASMYQAALETVPPR
ncbi:bacterial regulatory s, tetR family protein [Mycobacteroides abscessus MAB_091912_2446]|uniref:Bacterial regulatory s, tetR family protein n=1 Tax=Mycobacteroides abscessus MAB_091912_2446 TaxID=1335414 RepID=A0A829MAM0_9MYCO|nr:bacterial regulatory s, tetR family protein [Mycobacteroides abscessus MAB_091912_2446]